MNAASTGYIILNAALPTFVIMVVMSLRPKVLQQQESASITPPATTNGSMWEMPLIRWP